MLGSGHEGTPIDLATKRFRRYNRKDNLCLVDGVSVADILPIPRKRLTRENVIADQSMNFVERFIYAAGFTAQRLASDYGYDLMMTTFDDIGYIEPR
jgi:hypothetical protein